MSKSYELDMKCKIYREVTVFRSCDFSYVAKFDLTTVMKKAIIPSSLRTPLTTDCIAK